MCESSLLCCHLLSYQVWPLPHLSFVRLLIPFKKRVNIFLQIMSAGGSQEDWDLSHTYESWGPWKELGQNSSGPWGSKMERIHDKIRKVGWVLQGGSGGCGFIVGRGGSSRSGSMSNRVAKITRQASGNWMIVLLSWEAGDRWEIWLVKIWLTSKRPEFSCANLRFLLHDLLWGKK